MKAQKRDERVATTELIRGAGLRVTSARSAVLAALREAKSPLSHAELASQLEQAGIDRTTVYRNLVDLAEAGILQKSEVGHTFRFELAAAHSARGARGVHRNEQHPHFVCNDCGKVACLPAGSVLVKPTRGTPSALKRGNVEIHLRGLCDGCA